MTTAQPGQEQRMEIEALTDAEAESAFFTIIGMFDKLGCAPGGTVEKKEEAGVTFRLHFNADRVRRLLAATRPTANLGDDGEIVRYLRDYNDFVLQKAADRLILYREAREAASIFLDLWKKEPNGADTSRAADALSAVLSGSGDTKMGPPSRASGGGEAARDGPL